MKNYQRKKIVKALCFRYFIMTIVSMIIAAAAIYAGITYGPAILAFLSPYNPFIPGLIRYNIPTIIVAVALLIAALLIFIPED